MADNYRGNIIQKNDTIEPVDDYTTLRLLFNTILGPSVSILGIIGKSRLKPKLYIPSTPNNSNETHTFMCLGRTGRFGQR